jgi:hypothetical protein
MVEQFSSKIVLILQQIWVRTKPGSSGHFPKTQIINGLAAGSNLAHE